MALSLLRTCWGTLAVTWKLNITTLRKSWKTRTATKKAASITLTFQSGLGRPSTSLRVSISVTTHGRILHLKRIWQNSTKTLKVFNRQILKLTRRTSKPKYSPKFSFNGKHLGKLSPTSTSTRLEKSSLMNSATCSSSGGSRPQMTNLTSCLRSWTKMATVSFHIRTSVAKLAAKFTRVRRCISAKTNHSTPVSTHVRKTTAGKRPNLMLTTAPCIRRCTRIEYSRCS